MDREVAADPAIGDPEDAETLAFTATSEPPAQEDASTGYKGILNAPSSNRDGSAPGKGSGGFSAPDKQMEKLEALLDDLDKKDKGNPDRITTTEIVLAFLRNDRTPADLRKHLEGK